MDPMGYLHLASKISWLFLKTPWTLLILLREKPSKHRAVFSAIPRPSRGEAGSDAERLMMGDSFCLFKAMFFTFCHGKSISKGNPLFHYSYGRPDHARPICQESIVFFVRQIQGLSLLGFGLEVGESVPSPFSAKKTAFFFCVESVEFFEREMGCFQKILRRCFLCKLYTSINIYIYI